MSLDEIEAEFVAAHAASKDVARLHSGDLSIYSALAEQIRRLERRGIAYTLTPGVPAFAAAAAALGCELTVPEVAQSVVLTRVAGRASRMPETRTARDVCRDRRDARHPSRGPRDRCDREGADAILWRRLPGRRRGARKLARRTHLRGTLGDIAEKVAAERIERTALDPRRSRARGGGFPRERALRPGLSPQVSRRCVLCGLERRAADQVSIAIEHRNFDGDVPA